MIHSIRPMEEKDIPRVAEIHVFGWRAAYRGIIKDKNLFHNMLVSKRMEYFANALEEGKEETYVYDDGIVRAILTIGKSRDEDKKEAFELWGIYVDPFMQNEGIGSKLIRFCEEEALKRGHRQVILWTFKANTQARSFYEKHGYKVEGKEHIIIALEATEMRYIKSFK